MPKKVIVNLETKSLKTLRKQLNKFLFEQRNSINGNTYFKYSKIFNNSQRATLIKEYQNLSALLDQGEKNITHKKSKSVIMTENIKSFNGKIEDRKFIYKSNSIEYFFKHINRLISSYLSSRLTSNVNLKCYFCLRVLMTKPDTKEVLPFDLRTQAKSIHNSNDVQNLMTSISSEMIKRSETIQTHSSGWVFEHTIFFRC